ncbi:hypothetical protein F5Y10DRAFT_17012 [Nemania abortiva]|nr:hypothetical protein F5Y10DRAFT_17012 [Nemania abortiva]
MSNTAPKPSAPLRAKDSDVRWQSRIYQAFMTPINFVTFIISLYLIDNYHRAQRHRQHESNANSNNGRSWLHWLLYRERSSPYDSIDVHHGRPILQSTTTTLHHEIRVSDKENIHTSVREAGGSWFYQTKQRKLLRVEATEAFALRNSVLFVLCILIVSAGWGFWRTMVWFSTWGQKWIVFVSSGHADEP